MSNSSKFSTPNGKSTCHTASPYTPDSKSSQNFSIMKMISNLLFYSGPGQIDGTGRKNSLYLSNSNSTKSDESVIEDRFIPSRRLIQDFDLNENQPT